MAGTLLKVCIANDLQQLLRCFLLVFFARREEEMDNADGGLIESNSWKHNWSSKQIICLYWIINCYSSRTRRIWADIYNQQGHQLISGKSEKNNCFSKFSSNSLDFFRWNLLKLWHFLYRGRCEKIFPTSKISAQEIRGQFFLIWSNLTVMPHIMGLGNQSESWKIIILS